MSDKTTKHLKFFGIGKILPYLKHVRGQLAIMIFCGLCGSFVDIVLPLFQRYALDHFVGGNTLDTITAFVICNVGVILILAVVNYISCAQATIVEMKVNRELRQVGFRHLQTLSFSYFNQNSVGYIHARLMSDTGRIGGLVSWWLIDCTWRISYLACAIFVMVEFKFYFSDRKTVSLEVLEAMAENEAIWIDYYKPPLNHQLPKVGDPKHRDTNKKAKTITLDEILYPDEVFIF